MALHDLERHLAASPAERHDLAARVAARLAGGWQADDDALVHPAAQVRFRMIPGGTYRPGLSATEHAVLAGWLAEARAAQAWYAAPPPAAPRRTTRRTHRVALQLNAEEKALADRIDAAFGVVPSDSRELIADKVVVQSAPPPPRPMCPHHAPADVEMMRHLLGELHRDAPLRAPVQVGPFLLAEAPVTTCGVPGARPCTDAEWEWAARAGTTTLSWRGDGVPRDRDLVQVEADEDPDPNPLGLRGLGWRVERCTGDQDPEDGQHTYRGGGQDCAPWQGTGEFCFLLSAWRALQPDSAFAGHFRPAVPL